MSQLICKNITKRFQHKEILKQFDLCLSKGEVVGLLGVNGAGKSTSIKTLLGLVHAEKGDINLGEESIGFLPEVAIMPEHISALSFVSFSSHLRGGSSSDAVSTLEEVGIQEEQMRRPIRQLSKGLRQRVALAYALVASPQWIILDEPMSGLDAIGRISVLDILKQRKSAGVGILICSHIVPDLVRLSDRIMLMYQGVVREEVMLSSHGMNEVSALESRLRYWSNV